MDKKKSGMMAKEQAVECVSLWVKMDQKSASCWNRGFFGVGRPPEPMEDGDFDNGKGDLAVEPRCLEMKRLDVGSFTKKWLRTL
mmetsp:Transcript_8302/g.19268  ORF Transcript_8302/g.19268 Transcript_8302/m.19268 type:complete len:84 (-) Transcript_8302:962-1213(-)|eukprot:CAMPEP_0116843092 /NCGR_PEP_ID=MMETSP0418-20121206/11892_1 /TAXON_ID=1158023 /ORGANISM="Astrosyne radiata, Strain 13vi08-1A" /LENGTH=83 /DNA_ID=CAMNT_0004473799 /DNA_START=123 /DNA_END=374 /DNA_ORIENTATION=-